ncbi:MAG: efflux RND transporter permease subunit [Bacteroidota bacterium]|nr:efflux RND transporter permease subunit [Bacteroidota bacterium]
MTITEISIRRPVFLLMIFGAIAVFGLISLSRMGSSMFPETDFPYITVTTVYPGSNPEENETSVTKPIEEAVSTINGIKSVRSWSREGVSTVIVEFNLGIDGNNARLDVQKKVDEIRFSLPDGAEIPIVTKWDAAAIPVLNIAVYSKARTLDELYLIIDKQVKNKFQQVEGVADVLISGQKERQINITVDPGKLAQYKLSILDVVNSLKMENLDVPAGLIETSTKEFGVRVAGKFQSVDAIKKAPIVTPNGQEIYLQNIANVDDSFKRMKSLNRIDGIASLGIAVRPQSGSNSVRVADLVKQEMEQLKTRLPSDIEFAIAYDQSSFTKDSISEVRDNLLEAIVLTGFIIFIFLRNVRNTVIVLLAIPTSLIATFSLMYYAGFTFNMLSLMGLATSIGILVDDSIVVLENTNRHLSLGKNPFRAALDGRNEIGLAAIAITLTNVAVFIPIAFMGGMVGKFFAQFGLTITIAILFSLFVSFTLTPMLASRWLKKKPAEISSEKKNKTMDTLKSNYGKLSGWALGHRKTVLAVTTLIFLGSVALIPLGAVSTELFTPPDKSELMVEIETPAGTSLEKTDAVTRILEAKLAVVPEVKSRFVTLGKVSTDDVTLSSSQVGQLKLLLHQGKDFRSTQEVAQSIRELEKKIPGITMRVYPPNIMGGGGGNLPIQIEVAGTEIKDFNIASRMIMDAIKNIPGIMEVSSSWKAAAPEIKAEIDRMKCAALGIPAAVVGSTLRTCIEGDISNKYKERDREYDMMVTLPESKKKSTADISRMNVKSISGEIIELGQIARIYQDYGPVEIQRKNHNRQFVVTANVVGRPLGDVSNDVTKAIDKLNLPRTISKVGLAGDVEIMDETFTNLTIALLLSILFVYMVMASLFESFLYPFIVMFSLPITVVGAILALMITGKTLNIFSMIGVVMLVGLVVNNAILLVDYTNTLRKRGMARLEALIEAGKTRLRPILMTTLAIIFGMSPLALELGPGSEMRSGMAVVIMGGMISSSLLTLVFIPVVYSIVDDLSMWVRKVLKLRSVERNIDESLKS